MKYFLLAVFILLFLVSGCLETEDTTNTSEAECVIPSDCEGRIHIQCVGNWQCIYGKCTWQCSGQHLELPKEEEGLTG